MRNTTLFIIPLSSGFHLSVCSTTLGGIEVTTSSYGIVSAHRMARIARILQLPIEVI